MYRQTGIGRGCEPDLIGPILIGNRRERNRLGRFTHQHRSGGGCAEITVIRRLGGHYRDLSNAPGNSQLVTIHQDTRPAEDRVGNRAHARSTGDGERVGFAVTLWTRRIKHQCRLSSLCQGYTNFSGG